MSCLVLTAALFVKCFLGCEGPLCWEYVVSFPQTLQLVVGHPEDLMQRGEGLVQHHRTMKPERPDPGSLTFKPCLGVSVSWLSCLRHYMFKVIYVGSRRSQISGHIWTSSEELPLNTRSHGTALLSALYPPPPLITLNLGTNIKSSGCKYSFD